jgi:hypothetical protein
LPFLVAVNPSSTAESQQEIVNLLLANPSPEFCFFPRITLHARRTGVSSAQDTGEVGAPPRRFAY